MTEDAFDDDASKEELRAELRRTRSRLRAIEAELTETNEGMVALTLELENAKDRYQTIFEESTDGILLIDPDEDTICEANPQVCDLLGYDRERLIELTPADIFPHEHDRTHTFAEAIVQGWTRGYTCRTKDGRNLDVEISASVVTLDNTSLLLASIRDVTERKRREQRLQVLTRIFRHNLRNDGNVIQGNADLLADQLSNEELQERAEHIRRTIDNILRLSSKVRRTQDVLGRTRNQLAPLHELLDYQRGLFEQAYPEATLEVSLCEPEPIVIRRLNVAIEEILENAAMHAHDPVSVSIEAEVDGADGRVAIVIEDDGPGIPDDELKPMRTGGESPLTHGSSIGLWLVYWVVDSLGGELTFKTEGIPGTRLSLLLPEASEASGDERWNENIQT